MLDPSIPLTEVFKGYAESLAVDLAPRSRSMRYRLDVVAASVADVVRFAGGWMYDRVMAGWDVTVLLADRTDERPLQILGVDTADLESALALWAERPHPQTVAVAADLFASDDAGAPRRAGRSGTGPDRGHPVG